MTEKFKSNIMHSVFVTRNIPYCLRRKREFETITVKNCIYGTETVRLRASKTSELMPDEIKVSTTLSECKIILKKLEIGTDLCPKFRIYLKN